MRNMESSPQSKLGLHYGRLLESGEFADVEVKCGSRSWKLATSTRLELALRVVQQSAQWRIQEIPDIGHTSGTNIGIPGYLLDLYEMGDYFLMPELCQDSLKRLEKALDLMAGVIQRYRTTYDTSIEPDVDASATTHAKEFQQLLKRVSAHAALSQSAALRQLLVSFVTKTSFYFRGDAVRKSIPPSFTPKLASDILKANPAGIEMSALRYPRLCAICGNDIFDKPGGRVKHMSWEKLDQLDGFLLQDTYQLRGHCENCVRQHRIS
ncbi:hypothetical protein F5Y15DRAFT_399529 [Xylariaceae sp. FL0016]|nr:hypothetical protein F5Y15DRAFT_399529 [Xylariaceae sp. FL0016]